MYTIIISSAEFKIHPPFGKLILFLVWNNVNVFLCLFNDFVPNYCMDAAVSLTSLQVFINSYNTVTHVREVEFSTYLILGHFLKCVILFQESISWVIFHHGWFGPGSVIQRPCWVYPRRWVLLPVLEDQWVLEEDTRPQVEWTAHIAPHICPPWLPYPPL